MASPIRRIHFERMIRSERPNAVVLFGDERPVHRVARRIARAFGIPVWCFEEGYLRPNYVTFERDGNNANSPLPRSPEDYGFRPTWRLRLRSARSSFAWPPPPSGTSWPYVSAGALPWLSAPPRPPAHQRDSLLDALGLSQGHARAARSGRRQPPHRVPPGWLLPGRPPGARRSPAPPPWTRLDLQAVHRRSAESFARSAGRPDHLVFKVHPLGSRPHPHLEARVARGGSARSLPPRDGASVGASRPARQGLPRPGHHQQHLGRHRDRGRRADPGPRDTFYRVPGLAIERDDPLGGLRSSNSPRKDLTRRYNHVHRTCPRPRQLYQGPSTIQDLRLLCGILTDASGRDGPALRPATITVPAVPALRVATSPGFAFRTGSGPFLVLPAPARPPVAAGSGFEEPPASSATRRPVSPRSTT